MNSGWIKIAKCNEVGKPNNWGTEEKLVETVLAGLHGRH